MRILIVVAVLFSNIVHADCTNRPNLIGGTDVECDDGSRYELRSNRYGGYDVEERQKAPPNQYEQRLQGTPKYNSYDSHNHADHDSYDISGHRRLSDLIGERDD